jgi:hypothetical protein
VVISRKSREFDCLFFRPDEDDSISVVSGQSCWKARAGTGQITVDSDSPHLYERAVFALIPTNREEIHAAGE